MPALIVSADRFEGLGASLISLLVEAGAFETHAQASDAIHRGEVTVNGHVANRTMILFPQDVDGGCIHITIAFTIK